MTAVAENVEQPSLSRQIYVSLRERIIRGHYPQGSRLAEVRIAEELMVSRVPIREAVPQLEMEGFVQTFPRRGAVVTSWTPKLIHELFDLREVLEVGAAGHAARAVRMGASAAALEAEIEHSQLMVAAGDHFRIAEASTRFHEAIVAVTGNQLMQSALRSVSGRMMWLFFLTSELDVEDAFHDHVELARAIGEGDERMAEALAFAHIERDRMPSFAVLHADP